MSLHTPGHTADHLCLFDPAEGVVLSGDHVLPTITPHISGLAAGADPLTEFFRSLDKVAELEGVQLVLPAHGHPFVDLAGRAKEIREHHEERLDTLRSAAEELGDATVEDYMQRLFKPRSWGQMAESETYAHLEHLPPHRRGGLAQPRTAGCATTSSSVRSDARVSGRRTRAVAATAPSASTHTDEPAVVVAGVRPGDRRARLDRRAVLDLRAQRRRGRRRWRASASSTTSQYAALFTCASTSRSVARSAHGSRHQRPAAGRGARAGP